MDVCCIIYIIQYSELFEVAFLLKYYNLGSSYPKYTIVNKLKKGFKCKSSFTITLWLSCLDTERLAMQFRKCLCFTNLDKLGALLGKSVYNEFVWSFCLLYSNRWDLVQSLTSLNGCSEITQRKKKHRKDGRNFNCNSRRSFDDNRTRFSLLKWWRLLLYIFNFLNLQRF